MQKPTILPRSDALGVVVIANFSLAFANTGPTLKVCLPASEITSGKLVNGCFREGKKGTQTAQVSYTSTQRTLICFLSDKQRTKQTNVSDPQVNFNVLLLDKRGCSGQKMICGIHRKRCHQSAKQCLPQWPHKHLTPYDGPIIHT